MAAVNNKYDMNFLEPRNCTICGVDLSHNGNHWQFPFLDWSGTTKIRICGKCCQKIKVGFMEDLIHVTATMEMQQVRPYRPRVFKRFDKKAVEMQSESEHIADILDTSRHLLKK
jgi:hypothetical protein